MSDLTPSRVAEMEALREVYAALNRNDIQGFMKAFDPQVEWSEFLGLPGGGTYRGYATVEAHASKARAAWAEGSCKPERFIVAPSGDKVIVFVYVRVRLKHETEWREGSIADVYTFRDGKVIQARVFADRRQALDWAGASDAN